MPPIRQIKKLPKPALGPKQTLPQPGIRQQLKTAMPAPGERSGTMTATPSVRPPLPKLPTNPQIAQRSSQRPSTGNSPPPPGPGVGTGGTYNLPGQGDGTFNKPGVGSGGTMSLGGQQVGTFNKPQTGPPSLQDRLDAWAAKQEAARNEPIATDSIYGAETNNNLAAYNNQIAAYGVQGRDIAEKYGNWDDPSKGSPYSRAALLSAAWEKDRRGIVNSSAAAGQLYSGAMQNADDYAQADYLGNVHDAKSEQQLALQEILGGVAQAGTDYTQANIDAFKEFGDRYAATRPDEAPPPPKFVKEAQNLYQERLKALKAKRDDAKNPAARKKITKKIKKIKDKLGSIPDPYEEV